MLGQYVTEGVGELDQSKLTNLLELKYDSVVDATAQLGGAAIIRDRFVDFQQHLYSACKAQPAGDRILFGTIMVPTHDESQNLGQSENY